MLSAKTYTQLLLLTASTLVDLILKEPLGIGNLNSRSRNEKVNNFGHEKYFLHHSLTKTKNKMEILILISRVSNADL